MSKTEDHDRYVAREGLTFDESATVPDPIERIASALERIAEVMENRLKEQATIDLGSVPTRMPGSAHDGPSQEASALFDQDRNVVLPQFCQESRRSSTHGLMQCQLVPGHQGDHHYAPVTYLHDNPTPHPIPN